MAIEVYKHEIGTTVNTHPQDWRFYWEVQNLSGRNPMQIGFDIAAALEGILGWFSAIRSFWPVGSKCQCYRIRRMTPTLSQWNDMYYAFNDYGGRTFLGYGTSGAKINMRWVVNSDRIHNARTEFRYFDPTSFKSDSLVGQYVDVCKAFGDLHVTTHTTAFGDTFVPVILGSDAQYHRVVAYWIDTRTSFRHTNRRR